MNLSINKLKFFIKLLADVAIVYLSLYLAIIINAERLLLFQVFLNSGFDNYIHSNNYIILI